jgi:phage terminase small subunit
VTDTDTLPAPPGHLSEPQKRLWTELVERFDFDIHELKLLRAACEALDRANQARRAIRKHGLTYESRYGAPVARPEIKIESQANRLASTLIRQLGIPTEEITGTPRITYGRRRKG